MANGSSDDGQSFSSRECGGVPFFRGTNDNQENRVNNAVQSFVRYGGLIVDRHDEFLVDVVDAYINAMHEHGSYPGHRELMRRAFDHRFPAP